MGLDTSHDCWHGSYSSFSIWRNALWRANGGTTSLQGRIPLETLDIDWDAFEEKNYQGEWDIPPEDPLLILMVHSDCDGVIKPEHAPWLAERLERMLPALVEDNWVHQRTEQFIKGLRLAVEHGEEVDFH